MILSLFFLESFVLFSFLFVASASNLENTAVVRYIDISTQLVIVNSHIKAINYGSDPVDSYVYIVDPDWVEDLSFIEVFDAKKRPLVIQEIPKTEYSGKTSLGLQYEIVLPHPISHGETIDFIVSLVVTNYLKSYPKSVMQNEKHMVLFPFNIYYYSKYSSQLQTTYLYMGTTKVALIDGAKYTLANDSKYGLQYGPFYEVEPLKNSQSVFHYENNSPFLVVEKVKRYIKLSHWGFISVWDEIRLYHSGPKLKGPFKREHGENKNKASKDTKIERYVSTLPSNAFDVYLKDNIGLIWSFEVDYDAVHGVAVSVAPRHVLYGGWKTEYEIGYSLPISDFLSHFHDEHKLTIPFMDDIFENMVIKEAEINIILPEGASFKTMDPAYFDITNGSNAKYCYYIDIACREIITFRLHNLVAKHISDVSVTYTFSQINILIKPIAIIIFLNFILLSLKILSMADFSIQSEKKVFRRLMPKENPLPTAEKKEKNKRNLKQK